jgi:hypothetical protein
MTVAGTTARTRRPTVRTGSPAPVGSGVSRRKRAAFLILVNLLVFSVCFVVAEVAFRLFWNPRYWIHTDRLLVGSGQTEVGK